jgi:hypothetical protein
MSDTQQVKKVSTGTARIVWGVVLMAWGLLAALRSIAVMDGYAFAGLIPLAFGVWLLVVGLNKRRHYLNR